MQCPATAPPGVNLSPFYRAAQDYISLLCLLDQPQSASQPPELTGKPTKVGGANHRNWARRSFTHIEASDPTVGASAAAPCPQFDWEVAEKGAQTSGTGLEGSNALIGASKPIIGASAAVLGSVEDSPDPIVP